jgi:hypothetical protein
MLFCPAKATALLSQALTQGRPLARTGSTAMAAVFDAHLVFRKAGPREVVRAIS